MPSYERPFEPGETVSVSAGIASARVALPTEQNMSRTIRVKIPVAFTGTAFIKFGDDTVVAAATDMPMEAADGVARFGIPSGQTHMAVILSAGTTTVYATAGRGN